MQQAGSEFVFTTQLRFMNLTQAELGTLLIVLGQDPQNKMALKVGGGKPIGMETMTVEVTAIERLQLRDRYSSYEIEPDQLTGNQLQSFIQTAIQAAHRQLVQIPQLQELKQVLQWPTDREPPEGMY